MSASRYLRSLSHVAVFLACLHAFAQRSPGPTTRAQNITAGQSQPSTAGTAPANSTDLEQAATQTALQQSAEAVAKSAIVVSGSTNVKDNVSVDAVLLPAAVASRVFGDEIAQHYIVVQVVIQNKSTDSSFILQSLYLDSRNWLLAGLASQDCPQPPPPAFSTCPGQISSVEYRVIRGELQDAATWTVRNGLIRAATMVGAVAAGIPAFGSKNAVRYVSAYNGELVPGLAIFWPDPTVAQLNHVSDLGYQTNKVFPKG